MNNTNQASNVISIDYGVEVTPFDEIFYEATEKGFVTDYTDHYNDYFFRIAHQDLQTDKVKYISTPDGTRRILLGIGNSKVPLCFNMDISGNLTLTDEEGTRDISDEMFVNIWESEDMVELGSANQTPSTELPKRVESVEVEVKDSKLVKVCLTVTTVAALAVAGLIFYDRFR